MHTTDDKARSCRSSGRAQRHPVFRIPGKILQYQLPCCLSGLSVARKQDIHKVESLCMVRRSVVKSRLTEDPMLGHTIVFDQIIPLNECGIG
jgi:hypothetical protein